MVNIRLIKNFLKKYNTFLITAHVSPEGDSLGSQLALAKVLRKMGKQCEIVNADIYSREYLFLPGIGSIRRRPRRKRVQAIIVLDSSNIERVGSVVKFFDKNIPLLNIDHHVSNTCFGDINIVDANVSSACELLYSIFKSLKVTLNREIATCLYTGIVVDTGSFRYSNTTAATHSIAARLLEYGIDASAIYKNVYANLRFLDLECIAKTLLSVKKDRTGKIAWAVIPYLLLKQYGPAIDLTDNVLSYIRLINGVEVCALFKEHTDKGLHIRVNLRSQGTVDVNRIANHFGGGGHKAASGLTLTGMSLAQAEKKVIRFIKNRIGK